MVTFCGFPKPHWKDIRTTNVIESPFAAVQLRTGAAKRYKKVANATAVIWKTLLVAEKRFRRLHAPHLVAEVAEGAVFVVGWTARRPNSTTASLFKSSKAADSTWLRKLAATTVGRPFQFLRP